MARYRNTGAPIPREDGSFWGRGAVEEAAEREAAMFAYKLVLEEGEEPDEPEEADPLDDVAFASPQAEKLARDEELTATDFAAALGTGEGHAFKLADVQKLLGEDGD